MFAQELMDMILDNVKASAESTDALKSFSLVAHRFLAPCQRHLFRALTAERWSIEELSWTLEDAPHLASYILDFSIDFNIGERGSRLGVQDTDVHVALVSLFTVLCNVERLSFSSRSAWTTDSLAVEVKSALIGFLALPSLRSLSFVNGEYLNHGPRRDSGIPSSLIIHALSSYKKLTLGVALVVHHDETFIPVPPTSSPPILQTLELHCSHIPGLALAPLPAVMLSAQLEQPTSQLQRLKLSITSPSGSLGRYRNLACTRTVRHLELELPCAPYNAINLPALPRLRQLTVRVPVYNFQVPEKLMATLADLPPLAPRLETIAIILSVNAQITADFEDYVDATPAPAVDAALATLVHLRAATFSIDADPRAIPHFTRCMATRLPFARAAGRLVFEARTRCDKSPLVQVPQPCRDGEWWRNSLQPGARGAGA